MICGKVPCLSQKMMIYYKMAMSGVYENVFQTSKNYLEGAKISFWNCKVWGGGPCSTIIRNWKGMFRLNIYNYKDFKHVHRL